MTNTAVPPLGTRPAEPVVDVLLSDGRVARIASLDGLKHDEITLVAEVAGEQLAHATAILVNSVTARVSCRVRGGAHGRGLATLLLEHLAATARSRGIRRFTAEASEDNAGMIEVLDHVGFDVVRRHRPGVVAFEMSTAASASAVAAADEREALAQARSLEPLLYPRSVVVVGGRRDGGGVGCAVLRAIRDGGFTGEVSAVHPVATAIEGTTAYPSFADLPRHVDLVVIAVPAGQVLAVVEQAALAGVSAAVILSSGFDELGSEGAGVQQQIVATARRHSMRIVGPNCLGVIGNDPTVGLNATFVRSRPAPGRLAIGSQSGGVGIALLDLMRASGLGLSSFVSLGNKADVSGNDLISAWLVDDRVSVGALYLESFGNAMKFARLARRFSQRKPLLAVVGGRSAGGQRAGASHTAAAVAPSSGIDALFAQAGVIDCRGLDVLVDTARLLLDQPLPDGARIGIIGNAGGLGVIAADVAASSGLIVPELSASLQREVAAHVAGTVGVGNPIDLGAAASADDLRACVRALGHSNEVDAVLVIVAATAVSDPDAMVAAVEGATGGAGVPVLLVTHGEFREPPRAPAGVTWFRSVESALVSLGHAAAYSAWRQIPHVETPTADEEAAERARAEARRALADPGTSADGWASVERAGALLGCYGIRAPVGQVVRSAAGAAEAAEAIGWPVVLKVADPAVVHKTERGLVATGIQGRAEAERVVDRFAAELGRDGVPVLVQPVVTGGVELAVGLVQHADFGPLVMVAAGGVTTDLLQDRVFLVPPLTETDAARALRSLRIWPLLHGYRAAEQIDNAAMQRLIVAVGQLAVDVPEIAEMDLNPVMLTASGAMCVDVKVRVALVVGPLDPGVPRRLTRPR